MVKTTAAGRGRIAIRGTAGPLDGSGGRLGRIRNDNVRVRPARASCCAGRLVYDVAPAVARVNALETICSTRVILI
jgi:hypothetical protein